MALTLYGTSEPHDHSAHSLSLIASRSFTVGLQWAIPQHRECDVEGMLRMTGVEIHHLLVYVP